MPSSESTPRPIPPGTGRRRERRLAAAAAGFALIGTAFVAGPAFAAHPTVSLPGSDFEIDVDANLVTDDADPWFDWDEVDETRQPDLASGSGDDSFGQGSKEDTAVPTVVDGSIPPNKSDLLNFGAYLEETGSGSFLHLFWHRVQEPSGTTNMDFEFNQSDEISDNGVTPVRTEADLLIQYDLAQGGTNPELFLAYWLTDADFDGVAVSKDDCVSSNKLPCWGLRSSLTASGDATGSINTSAIAAGASDGLGAISPRTFGEASVDFSAIVGTDECISFGSAYLKSRSSDSFTAALKDFIAPADVDLTNCAQVIIRKQTVPDGETQSFAYTTAFETQDDGTNPSFNLVDDGSQTYNNVFFGDDLTVTETMPLPTGWALTSIDCSDSSGVNIDSTSIGTGVIQFDLDDATDVLDCTYTNTLQTGSILIEKTRKHAAADPPLTDPHAGVTFTVTGGDLTEGIEAVTGDDGTVCVDDLVISSVAGDYTVTETVPTGYVSDDEEQDVTVTLGDGCGGADDSNTVSFHNTPLTDLTVSVDSQVDGGTFSSIECDATVEEPDDAAPDIPLSAMQDDPSVTIEDLEPGTYTCVVVIDP